MIKKKNTSIPDNCLTRRDLLTFEQDLCDDLSRIVSFSGHALYFPTEKELFEPTYIPEENKLLIPLLHKNRLLGVILLSGVSMKQDSSFMDFLLTYVQVCLDKLAHIKMAQFEPDTSLIRSHLFMKRIEEDICAVQQYLQNPDTVNRTPQTPWQTSVALIALPILNLHDVRRQYGFVEAEKLFRTSISVLQNILPENAVCACLRDNELFILVPGASLAEIERLAQVLVNTTASIKHPLSTSSGTFSTLAISSGTSSGTFPEPHHDMLIATFCAGYSIYPQDWDGRKRSNNTEELSYMLVENAHIASSRLMEVQASQATLNFDKILAHGAQVTEILPFSNLRINIGSDVGAKKEMLFSVWSRDGLHYRGDLMLTKIEEKSSIGEMRIMGDPVEVIEKGNLLYYQVGAQTDSNDLDNPDGQDRQDRQDSQNRKADQNDQNNNITITTSRNILSFQNFFRRMHIQQIESVNAPFCLLLLRLDIAKENILSNDVYTFIQSQLKNIFGDAMLLMGAVSFNSLIIYHPNISPEEAQAQYEHIAIAVKKEFKSHVAAAASVTAVTSVASVAIGIAHSPYLNYHLSTMWDCARKALDYAILLPYPHVGIFDSLAINISADRKYSQGDIYSAIEEYRLALLADEKNNLARNSLGVCLATLGRHSEAYQIFSDAQNIESQMSQNSSESFTPDASTSYNLGTSCLSLKEYEKAKEAFHSCLKKEKDHVFARIRLGEIAENHKDYDTALNYYAEVQKIIPESSLPLRCIARINLAQEKPNQARENLQGALRKNPNDAIALQILAELYLESGDDASLAEMLAKQSVALNPWRNAGWLTLSKALYALGREKEANTVLRRLGTMS